VSRFFVAAILYCCLLAVEMPGEWTVTSDSHFAIYSQGGNTHQAEEALAWFEQLRSFFEQSGLPGGSFADANERPVTVVVFSSTRDYAEFRLRPLADAYYTSVGARNYIVMAGLQSGTFNLAAHEYSHYVLHASHLNLPACINEGLAEFFSTLHFGTQGYELGGDLPGRAQILRRNALLPMAELLSATYQSNRLGTREGAAVFYAESWALVDLLLSAPALSPKFSQFLMELNAGSKPGDAIGKVYGLTLEQLSNRLENAKRSQLRSIRFVGSAASAGKPPSLKLSVEQTGFLLAEIAGASGHLAQARERYEKLQQEYPGNPDVPAELGTIAFRQGNQREALRQWQLAIHENVNDAELCYRYAVLAEEAGASGQDLKAALERAIALAPNMDDARYKLALIEDHAGDYVPALEQLKAMHVPSGSRSYAYWIAMTSVETDLDDREAAAKAAQQAVQAAQTEADKQRARMLAYVAATDLTVQFASDAEGHSRMVTTRVPHGTKDFNPFIEQTDHMQRTAGSLTEVLCANGSLTGFVLRTAAGKLTVEVPDPLHVLMRNAPAEFYCGAVSEKPVEADYAITQAASGTRNILRGMRFSNAAQ